MLDTTQNCCRSRLALDHKLLTNSATVAKKISQNISKSLVCHRFKGVFYPTLSFYTLDLWPCQPWSAIESCNVADLISKRNKLWKRFRDSLEIRNISNLYLHCTEQPPQYWCYPPTVLMLSPHCTEGIPPLYWIPSTVLMLSPTVLMLSPCMYWCFPPVYWIPSTVLKLSPTVLMLSPHCTEQPPQYWRYPPTVLKLSPHMYCCYPPTVLKVSLHSTEYPPQYWCYPPQYWCYPRMYWCFPPLYWTTSTVLKLSPTVLKLSPHCTEQPPQYWSYPPQYWCYPPDVLNNLQCTEPTLCGVIMVSLNWQRKS